MKKIKLFFALFAMLALGVGNAWGETTTLSTSNIGNSYNSSSTSYREINDIKDDNGFSYNAYAILNQHSKATSSQKFLQIKKYAKNVAYYIQIPTMPGNITSISMTVSSSSKAMDGGGNTATLYFSNSNSTSTEGNGIASGTGAESVTIDCSSLNLKEGFITAGGAVRIWDITITYETSGSTEPVASVTLTPDVKDFGTVNVGDKPSQEFTITTENTTAALTASIDNTTNYAVSAITGDKVTVTYQPQSAGTHSAVLTVKAGEEATATVNLTGKAVEALEGTWILVTDASSLKAGDEIIIAAKESDVALSTTQASNNRPEVAITKNANTITATSETQVLILQAGNKENTLALYTGDGYLYAASSGSNYLRTETTLSDNSSWSIAVAADGTATMIAQGENTRNTLYYNKNSKIFSCYSNAQQPIALYKKVDPNAVIEPVFTPIAGEYYGTQSVEITCATVGAEIYYTLDETEPTSASTKYTGAISIASTTTIKAVAIKGENSSAVVSATYTILAPLATMQEIFDKATDATQSVHIKFNDWVISGVVPGKDGKPSSNAYITDGSKGFIIYTKDGHGFNVGDKLSGTVVCDLTRYNGSAEVVGLTSLTTGLSVTTGGVVTPVEVADKSTLSGVNTGAVIKITGVCTSENSKYYVAGVQLYNSLFAYTNPTGGKKYNVTGVYLQYNDIPEILPRSAADIEEIIDLSTATIAIADMTMEIGESKTIEATITPDAAQSTVQYAITAGNEYITLNGTTITAVAAGTATITATIAEVAGEYYGATKTFNVTVKPQNIAELPFEFTGVRADIENTLGMSQDGLGTDYTTAGVTTNLKFDGTDDRVIIHFNGQADKLAYDIKGNGFSGGTFSVQQSADGSTYTEVVTYTELGDAATKEHELAAESRYVKFIYTEKSSGNVGLGNISITKADHRQDAGLVWNPATVSLTVGDAFTAPTLSNPNGLTGITFTSDNEALATVNNAGVISLVSGKTGTATITATFADGDATYKPAEVTCVITVSPKSEKVVILAEYNGQWYALKAAYFSTYTNRLAAIPVNYVGGKLYNVAEADKATIEWQLAMNGAKATFKNGDNYLTGTDGTDLTLSTTAFEWDYDGELYLSDGGTRTFIYHKDGYFRNYATSNAIPNSTTYSDKPVVTAPVYDTAIEIGSGDNSTVIAANQGQIVKVIVDRAFEAGDEWYTLCVPFNMQASLIGTAYQLSGLVQKGTDYVEVNLAPKNTIEAGKPYLVKPNVTVNKFVVENVTIVNTTGESIAKSIEGLSVEMQGVINGSGTTGGLYWVGNSGYLYNDDVAKLGLRTYFNITTPSGIAPRMRVVAGENVETGVEDLFKTDAPVKVIENGQLIIIRDGVKYNVQGQKL